MLAYLKHYWIISYFMLFYNYIFVFSVLTLFLGSRSASKFQPLCWSIALICDLCLSAYVFHNRLLYH